jgi:hypothetical protein
MRMEFHLPFYAWREATHAQRDSRKRNGAEFRKTLDLSFLQPTKPRKPGDENEWLHEAQVSCVMEAYNSTFWTAYVSVDTYFDGNTGKDSLAFCDEGTGLETGPYVVDPLPGSRYNYDANMPLKDPREYFLRVLMCRSDQVMREWQCVVHELHNRIEDHVSSQRGSRTKALPYVKGITNLRPPRYDFIHHFLHGSVSPLVLSRGN